MIVTEIEAANFMAYEKLHLTLPETGIVLVTGGNGQGKSAIAEAVAYALWGKTLRGTSPWREGTKGLVRVAIDDVVATRTKSKIQWARHGDEPTEYATKTKSQEALLKVVGDREVWRKCSVFSASDAALFSQATDKERKSLLESLLGIGRFDEALEACRDDMKVVENKGKGIRARLDKAQALVEKERTHLKEAHGSLKELEDPDEDLESLQADRDELQSSIDKNMERQSAARKDAQQIVAVDTEAQIELDRAREQLELFRGGKCPTCEQTVPKGRLNALVGTVERGEKEANKRTIESQKMLKEVEDQGAQIRSDARELRASLLAVSSKINTLQKTENARARFRENIGKSKKEIGRLEEEVQSLAQEIEEVRIEFKTLASVERVLGYKGVRSKLLGDSLSGLQGVANAYLARFYEGDVSLELKPYSEKKSGGISDSISLEVTGVAGGLGYKASSSGQRRRLDVALLLALAEISDAAHGRQHQDLWFDEVFDTLDEGGVAALVEILQELAEDRKVVVISHHPDMVSRLLPHAKAHYHVEDFAIQTTTTRAA